MFFKMYFKKILIFTFILIPVIGADYLRYARESITANRFERVHCWSQMAQLNSVMRQATCKPRDTMVDVISEAANVMIFPNKVAVKRCDGGSCYGQSSCLPLEVQEVPFSVRKHDFTTGRETCGVVYVTEHTSCKCGCSVMSHHCTHKQEYRHSECMCQCLNLEEEVACLDEGKIWDPRTCNCMCKEMYPECSTGTEWVPSMCKCKRIMMEEPNDVLDTDFRYYF